MPEDTTTAVAEGTGANAVPIATLLKRFKEAETARKNKYETYWDDADKYYSGAQWEGVEKIAYFQSEPVYNKVYEFIETMRSYLADNKWGLDVFPVAMPEEVEDELNNLVDTTKPIMPTQGVLGVDPEKTILDIIDRADKLMDFLWLDQRLQNKLAQVLLYVFKYGTGLLKSVFNGTDIGDTGVGQIETTVVSPRYIFPDPAASSVHDASFIFEHHPVTFRWVIERYPEKAMEVRQKGLGSTTTHNERGGDLGAGAADSQEASRVDVYEAYYIDSSIAEDDESATGYSLAYPNGRCTIFTSTGVVLEDYENPYSMFPYVRFIEVPRPGEFFGDATIWRGFGIQDTINSLLRSIIDNSLWMAHGIFIADTTSGTNPKKLSGIAPRDTIMKNPGTEVRRDVGEALPYTIFDLLNEQVQAFDRVVGMPDVLRGIVPSRQPVGTVQMQKEAGDVRTRERARRVEEALEDLGQLWWDIVAEHWNDKRTINGKRATGGLDLFQLSKEDIEGWRMSIRVIPGSTTPFDVENQMEKARVLVNEMGVALPPTYLTELSRLPGATRAYMDAQRDLAEGENPETEQPAPEMPLSPAGEMPPEPEMGGMEGGIGPETAQALAEAESMGLPAEIPPMQEPLA